MGGHNRRLIIVKESYYLLSLLNTQNKSFDQSKMARAKKAENAERIIAFFPTGVGLAGAGDVVFLGGTGVGEVPFVAGGGGDADVPLVVPFVDGGGGDADVPFVVPLVGGGEDEVLFVPEVPLVPAVPLVPEAA